MIYWQPGLTEQYKYLYLLSRDYPNKQSVYTEIINLKAILNLPKGTEHFISDIHGEYDAFLHIMNNCSGVIAEKIDILFKEILTDHERADLCTLIYYPEEKLKLIKKGALTHDCYSRTLSQLIAVAKLVSSKYTRSKVRKALPKEFGYIIDELMHTQFDNDSNRTEYHKKILETIINLNNADEFIIALSNLIKRLAVDYLHIVGDIYDRGASPHQVMDVLCGHHSIDIQWGNHDILWMGAASGGKVCIAAVLRNNLRYGNLELFERGYGISLRSLTLFAERYYPHKEILQSLISAITVILLKLEGGIIKKHPEYAMESRLLLDKIDFEKNQIDIEGVPYKINAEDFPTVEKSDVYNLTHEEYSIMDELAAAFNGSERLKRHIDFLYSHGSIYKCHNENLLFHGCITLNKDGSLAVFKDDNGKNISGKALLDYADKKARQAYFKRTEESVDYMYYLWCGKNSPLCGKDIKTFERHYIDDKKTWQEAKNPYFDYYNEEPVILNLLKEFGLDTEYSHIINGHMPVRARDGENPVKAGGRLIIIDGGFCKSYQPTTGIAGYTLIINSHCLKLKSHSPFESKQKVITENSDIESASNIFETYKSSVKVKDTDIGKTILEKINDLTNLLEIYAGNDFNETEGQLS